MGERRCTPVLNVAGESMPEAWENSYLELATKGLVYKRDDEKDRGNQFDSYMIIEIRSPDSDPFSHLKGGTNAIDAPLLDYYYEMMGAKDSWVRALIDTESTIWQYMYHTCLGAYQITDQDGNPIGKPINQLDWVVKRLVERPFSRRTNIITWYPPRDMVEKDTPCLQRLWFQIIPGGEKDILDMHYNFRSRNVVNASFGNIQGLYMLGCDIRDKVEEASGKSLAMRMIDNIDSYHVNSHDMPIFLANVNKILESIGKGKSLEQRTWSRAQVVNGLKTIRDELEETIMRQTEKNFKEDLEKERERVHSIGDRIFYLLDKYAPK